MDDQGEVINEEGVEGEVQVKGEPIFDDYINDDINGEFQDGWFITGDIGSWISGELVLTGRSFDRLIVNGVNYSVPAINQKIEEYCNERGYSNTICAIASVIPQKGSIRTSLQPLFLIISRNSLQFL